MVSFDDQVTLLERALADKIPESRAWVRNVSNDAWYVELQSPAVPDGRKLTIELTGGDFHVGLYVGPTGVGLAPYELNAGIPAGREAEAINEMVDFVADFLAERLVVAMRSGFWQGGRVFLEPGELTPARQRELIWIASWRGTYDWAIPR